MNVVVTGVTGFIGRSLVPILLESGHFIRKVVRTPVTEKNNSIFQVDSINLGTEWRDCFKGIDAVVHLAGIAHSGNYSKEEYECVNTHGTLNMAKSAAKSGVKRFIYISTIGVNGNDSGDGVFSSSDIPNPHNDCSFSKYHAEVGLQKIAEDYGMGLFIIRPVLVYGKNAPGNFSLLLKVIKKISILPFGLINNRRSFISVDNLCDLLKTCLEHTSVDGGVFLASEGDAISTKDFSKAIAQGYGKVAYNLPIPLIILHYCSKLVGKPQLIKQLTSNLEVDTRAIKKTLNWSAPYTMQESMSFLNKQKRSNID